jgi:hypothetical protein
VMKNVATPCVSSSTTWGKYTDCVRYGGIPQWHSSNWSSLVWCIQPISAFNMWSVNVNGSWMALILFWFLLNIFVRTPLSTEQPGQSEG